MPNHLRGIAVLAALLCAHSLHASDDMESSIKSITEAYAIVEDNAADPVSAEQVFFQGAIPGMLRRLDPHSVFFDPGQFEQLRKLETSTQKGFGSVVSVLPGRVIVLQTLPGTPSAKSGMAPGDEILARIRQSSRCAGVPVIVITSSDSPQDRARARDLGASFYFRKPADLEKFMAIGGIVRGFLETQKDAAPQPSF